MIHEPAHAATGINDFIEIMVSALLIFCLTTFLLTLNWRMTCTLLLILAVTVGCLWKVSIRFSKSMGQNRSKLNRDVSQVIVESANGIRQIKICGNEREVFAELQTKQQKLLSMIDRFAAVRSAPKEVGEFTVMCVIVMCLFWGAFVRSDNLSSMIPELAVFSVGFLMRFDF
jgi:ABC-type transport system involved in cytochrome bd biosynthesis fused ATPase/permease subunit